MTPNQLIEARRKLGWTQREIAKKLDITPDHVSRMERGVKAIERRTELAVRYLCQECNEDD